MNEKSLSIKRNGSIHYNFKEIGSQYNSRFINPKTRLETIKNLLEYMIGEIKSGEFKGISRQVVLGKNLELLNICIDY